jgi:hypothetical protein
MNLLLPLFKLIQFHYAITAAFLPMSDVALYDINVFPEIVHSNAYYAKFQGSISFYNDIFNIGGHIKTTSFRVNGSIEWKPVKDEYMVFIFTKYQFVEIGFNRYCTHPITSYLQQLPPGNWQGAYAEVYIKFEK